MTGTEVKEQQPAVGEVQPAAALTTQDKFHWQMNDIRRLREEGDRLHEQLLERFDSFEKQMVEKFDSLERQIWIVCAIFTVACVVLR